MITCPKCEGEGSFFLEIDEAIEWEEVRGDFTLKYHQNYIDCDLCNHKGLITLWQWLKWRLG